MGHGKTEHGSTLSGNNISTSFCGKCHYKDLQDSSSDFEGQIMKFPVNKF